MEAQKQFSKHLKSIFGQNALPWLVPALILFLALNGCSGSYNQNGEAGANATSFAATSIPATTPELLPTAAATNAPQTPSPAVNEPASPGPVGPTGEWSLIFQDEFEGNSLAKTRWVTCYWWDNDGCTNADNQELEWYQSANVEVGQGLLKLIAQKEQVEASDGKTYSYTSGMVTTGRSVPNPKGAAKFAFKYGYVEIRANIPPGKSLWPSLWLLPANQKWPPEIDIMEMVGDEPRTVHMTSHYINASGQEDETGGRWTGPNFSTGFHLFALDWEPQSLVWYVDGVERQRLTNTAFIPAEKMYLVMNLAVGGKWPGAPNARTVFPSYFSIDYVRIWQRPATDTDLSFDFLTF